MPKIVVESDEELKSLDELEAEDQEDEDLEDSEDFEDEDDSEDDFEDEDEDSDDDDSDDDDSEEDEDDDEDSDEDDLVVLIDDEEDEISREDKKAPKWVKDLRRKNRDQEKELRELRKQVQAQQAASGSVPQQLGPEPTLADCGYDDDEFKQQYAKWLTDKSKQEQAIAQQQALYIQEQQAWQQTLNSYEEKKRNLKAKNFQEYEDIASNLLDDNQKAIIVSGSDNPALVVYTLGRNPTKAKELAKIDEPVKFAFAIAKLEKTLKVKKMSKVTPEKRVRKGSGSTPKASEAQLERLRENAQKTGDYSKLIAYKKRLKSKK